MKVLVTGGRDYGLVTPRTPDKDWLQAEDERQRVDDVLTALNDDKEIMVLIQGGASGADEHAEEWARKNEVRKLVTFVAQWNKVGHKGAGYIRNAAMLKDDLPDLVVAFPGGKGTASMIKLAQERGVPVQIVK